VRRQAVFGKSGGSGRMDVIQNERIKLGASLLNTMAASCFTVGVATPLRAIFTT
jgi:hypothetical protein